MPARTGGAAGALALAASLASAQAPVFNGDEFQVNTYTTLHQVGPAVAVDGGGHFVVVWAGRGAGDDIGIFGRRYRSSGVPLGPQFLVNTYTTGTQRSPSVAADAAGNFVVAWQSDGVDGDSVGIAARRFAPDGTPLGGEFLVNTYTTYAQYPPAVAMRPDGAFVVVWDSYGDGDGYGVAARRYDAAGAPIGAQFAVNTYLIGYQIEPDVAFFGNGSFVVTWQGAGPGDADGIFARRFDSAGTPVGGDFRVNTTVTGYAYSPSVAGVPTGHFVFVWADYDGGILGQRFDDTGAAVGSEMSLDGGTPQVSGDPAVSQDAGGDFVVTWTSYDGLDGYGASIRGIQVDAGGTFLGPDFQVNTYTTGHQFFPAVAGSGDGDFRILWSDDGDRDGDGYATFGQRLGDLVFSDGGESGTTLFWSAVQPGITTTPAAALAGTVFGFQAQVSGTPGVFVQDDSPENEDRYRARFYFDPNGHDPGEALNQRRVRLFVLFEEGPNRRLAAVVLRRLSGQYALSARVRLDDDSQANTPFTDITDAPHWVEVDWQRSSGPDANDGAFTLTIDGTPVPTLSGLDNSISSVDMVRLGTISNKSGANGQVYFDELVSRRSKAIGPLD